MSDLPLKALSVRQPWAFAILYCGKMIENRTWPCHHRGELALHASKGGTKSEYARDARLIERISGMRVPAFDDVTRGAIVATAHVTGCIDPGDFKKAIRLAADQMLDVRWWDSEQSGVVLDSIALLADPVCCDGKLGLWQLDDQSHAAVRDQVLPGLPRMVQDRSPAGLVAARIERAVSPHSIDSSFIGNLIVQLLTERQIGTPDACEMIRKELRMAVRGWS